MAYANPKDPRLRESRRKHYRNNKKQYLNRNKERKRVMFEYVRKIKDTPCKDCRGSFPYYVMDLDHRETSEKVDVIGKIILNGSWRKLYEEIKKCDIVCANCHRVRTAKQNGYY